MALPAKQQRVSVTLDVSGSVRMTDDGFGDECEPDAEVVTTRFAPLVVIVESFLVYHR